MPLLWIAVSLSFSVFGLISGDGFWFFFAMLTGLQAILSSTVRKR